jgi:predicted acetyltransferase
MWVSDDISISVAREADWDAFFATMSVAFNEEGGDPEFVVAERFAFEPHRCLVAWRDGELVGTAGIATRTLSVPGAVLPAAHVTYVAVAATARRQGVLTRFMHQQFTDARAAGESIAVLWASEGRIYQRFGYGQAVRSLRLEADSGEVRLPIGAKGTGRLREGHPTDIRQTLVTIYEQVYPSRPGWSGRADRHWDYRLADPPSWRRGSTRLRGVVHDSGDGPDGYALWRVQGDWSAAGPEGVVRLIELVAANPTAYVELWNFLLTLDLTRSVSARVLSVDEPLQYLVNEPRRLGLSAGDAVWLRILDLPRALAGRRYGGNVDLVLEVTDTVLAQNAGRWRLRGGPTAASCEPSTDEPDLLCDVKELGAAYLGGVAFTTLADAGLVREARPGALAEASMGFGWPRSPSATEIF